MANIAIQQLISTYLMVDSVVGLLEEQQWIFRRGDNDVELGSGINRLDERCKSRSNAVKRRSSDVEGWTLVRMGQDSKGDLGCRLCLEVNDQGGAKVMRLRRKLEACEVEEINDEEDLDGVTVEFLYFIYLMIIMLHFLRPNLFFNFFNFLS